MPHDDHPRGRTPTKNRTIERTRARLKGPANIRYFLLVPLGIEPTATTLDISSRKHALNEEIDVLPQAHRVVDKRTIVQVPDHGVGADSMLTLDDLRRDDVLLEVGAPRTVAGARKGDKKR